MDRSGLEENLARCRQVSDAAPAGAWSLGTNFAAASRESNRIGGEKSEEKALLGSFLMKNCGFCLCFIKVWYNGGD